MEMMKRMEKMSKLLKMTEKMMMEAVVGVVDAIEGEKIERWWEVADAMVRR